MPSKSTEVFAAAIVGCEVGFPSTESESTSASGPVRPGEPLHSAVGAALLRALPADQRARLHLETAKALYDSGAGSAVVVAQLTAAGQAPDEWAFPVLWAAAPTLSWPRVG